jgi:hypothetical protein
MRNTGAIPKNPVKYLSALSEFAVQALKLRGVNQWSTSSIIGDGDANVSLTSYGTRIHTVWKSIETIGAGTVKPRRIILWLDDAAALADPPASLMRLRARGLEIRPCRDYGPHKKYFPYVCEIYPDEPGRTLVTADDDVFYPPNWLDELLSAHRPDEVTAFRARIRSAGPYRTWPVCTTAEPSENVFATGVSGVAYPPRLLDTLRTRGDQFVDICPRADDYWLHFAAVATGVPIRQVRDTPVLWWAMLIASGRGLWDGSGAANDAIAAQTERAWLGLDAPVG